MNIDQAFPSKYLKAADFDEGDQTFTIETVKMEVIGQGEDAENKPIMYFSETEKGLVLNKTNSNTIKALYGSNTDAWKGKRLTLYGTEVQFGGEMKPAVRIRSKAPKSNEIYTMDQARALLEAAGVSLDVFKAALPKNAEGKALYAPERDSHVVDELLAGTVTHALELPF